MAAQNTEAFVAIDRLAVGRKLTAAHVARGMLRHRVLLVCRPVAPRDLETWFLSASRLPGNVTPFGL
jgi:hypothetical protein